MKLIPQFKDEFEFLSNFYSSSFVQGTMFWPTVEHAYQAAKTVVPYYQNKIRSAKTPAQAKRFGKQVQLREDWEQVKVSIMTELVWEKFDQNPELRDMLLDTGSAELIEGNWWHDNFWGDCFCQKCTNIKGKNMLGFILMEVRKSLDVFNPSLHSMTKEQKLREAVFLYIKAKKRLTTCMGEHFRQVCHNCKEYAKCLVYSGHVQAWMNLQDSYYVEKEIDDAVESK